jgi:hypothetical protein
MPWLISIFSMATKKASAAHVFSARVDIKWFRDQPPEALEQLRENERKRFRHPQIIDEVVAEAHPPAQHSRREQKTDGIADAHAEAQGQIAARG